MSTDKILVTGAGGFIGSHLTETLVRQGYNIRAFVEYDSLGSWGWLDHADMAVQASLSDVFSGDIRDPYGVRQAVSGCDIVLHLAALIGIPYSYHSPSTYVDINITGSLNVLQAARDLGVSRIVHTSTSEVYGTAQFVPITEQHPLHGQSPYSASKIGADQMAIAFHRSFETPVTLIRPFNTYGPRQSERAVIPTIIAQLLADKPNIRLGALSPTRDFNFVQDTVDAFIAMAQAPNIEGEVINIGSNYEISIENLAHTISDIIGVPINIETDETRLRPDDSEVERLWADNSLALDKLNWSPKYGGMDGLRRGISKTVDWFRKSPQRYRPNLYSI